MSIYRWKDTSGSPLSFNLREYWTSIQHETDTNYYETVCTNNKNPLPSFANRLFNQSIEGWIDLENNLAKIISNSEMYIEPVLFSVFSDFLVPKMEKYIANVVNRVDITKQFHIESADRILCFNYSNTFERLYNASADICYVNGKAKTNAVHPNIVFGCDFYDYSRADLTLFNKVAQRANIGTDGKYRQWLSDITKTGCNVSIVGHSLGKTDWDIICPFVTAANSQTTVYYHSEKSKLELIHHMLGMVSAEFMNQRVVTFKSISDLMITPSKVATVVDLIGR